MKEQKINIYLRSLVVILIVTLATPMVKATLNIDMIFITSYKEYLNGVADSYPWSFETWVEFVDTGDLHDIDITIVGEPLPFANLLITDDWGYDSPVSYNTLGNLQMVYPFGNYKFDFWDSSDTLLRSVVLNYSGLSEPLGPVNFTYPSDNGQTGISTNPTFTWTIASGAGDALGMWLNDSMDHEIYDDVPVSMTSSWTPGPLVYSHNYDLEVSVFDVNNLQPGPALPTMIVGGDEFKYALVIEHLNEITFTTEGPAAVPAPGALILGSIGVGFVTWLRRRRTI